MSSEKRGVDDSGLEVRCKTTSRASAEPAASGRPNPQRANAAKGRTQENTSLQSFAQEEHLTILTQNIRPVESPTSLS